VSKIDDKSKKRYGYLYPIRIVGNVNTHTVWSCYCFKCGSVTNISAANLVSGNSKGCQTCKGCNITLLKALKIIEDRANGCRINDLAKKYNVSRFVISRNIKKHLDNYKIYKERNHG